MLIILTIYLSIGCLLAILFSFAENLSDEDSEDIGEDFEELKKSIQSYDMIGEGKNIRLQIILTLIFLWLPVIIYNFIKGDEK